MCTNNMKCITSYKSKRRVENYFISIPKTKTIIKQIFGNNTKKITVHLFLKNTSWAFELKLLGMWNWETYFLPIAKARIAEWFLVKKYFLPASNFQSSVSESCSYPTLTRRFFASSVKILTVPNFYNLWDSKLYNFCYFYR